MPRRNAPGATWVLPHGRGLCRIRRPDPKVTSPVTTPEPPFRTTPSEPDVEPRLLRAFLAVAREGHFGHAARSIGVAQPALSKQVQQFERLLGVVLFDRTPRGAELTPGGRLIVPYAERALAHNRRLVRAARSVATGREGARC